LFIFPSPASLRWSIGAINKQTLVLIFIFIIAFRPTFVNPWQKTLPEYGIKVAIWTLKYQFDTMRFKAQENLRFFPFPNYRSSIPSASMRLSKFD